MVFRLYLNRVFTTQTHQEQFLPKQLPVSL